MNQSRQEVVRFSCRKQRSSSLRKMKEGAAAILPRSLWAGYPCCVPENDMGTGKLGCGRSLTLVLSPTSSGLCVALGMSLAGLLYNLRLWQAWGGLSAAQKETPYSFGKNSASAISVKIDFQPELLPSQASRFFPRAWRIKRRHRQNFLNENLLGSNLASWKNPNKCPWNVAILVLTHQRAAALQENQQPRSLSFHQVLPFRN